MIVDRVNAHIARLDALREFVCHLGLIIRVGFEHHAAADRRPLVPVLTDLDGVSCYPPSGIATALRHKTSHIFDAVKVHLHPFPRFEPRGGR